MKAVLLALAFTVGTLVVGGALIYGIGAWMYWATELPDPWSVLLSPLGAMACGIVALVFMSWMSVTRK